MKIKNQVSLQRLVGKVDNDFNISESDWIPRVGAWVIDALSQMKCLPMERKRRTLEVSERLAVFPCPINARELRVFDMNGCEIPELNAYHKCCSDLGAQVPTSEIGVYKHNAESAADTLEVANIVNNSNRKVLYVTSDQFIQDFIGINKKDDTGTNFNYVDFFKNK